MAILEATLLFTAILVSVGSVFFLRSSIQKNQAAGQKFRDAEQKYYQSREARLSAEDALRRAENEHRESERKLQQAHDELQAAGEIRRQARDEISAMARAKEQAEKERDAAQDEAREANQRARNAEEAHTVAEEQRDAAIKHTEQAEIDRNAVKEEARLAIQCAEELQTQTQEANGRAERAETLQKQAEDARDVTIKERNEAIQARKIAEENARRAIQAKFDAEEQARQAKELAKAAEKARDVAEQQRDDAVKAKSEAEDRAQRFQNEAHLANERAEQAKKERKQAINATKRAIRRRKKCISPENRKGARSRYEQPSVAFAPHTPKPEIICQDKNLEWVLALKLPEDFLNNDAELQVHQENSPLHQINDLWQLEDACGRIRVNSGEKLLWETDLGKREEDYLLFKLSGYDLRHGTRVRSINKGAYLVVVPEDWDRENSNLGSEPEAISIEGYLAYYHVVDRPCKIAFRTPDGKSVDVAQSTSQFDLIGILLPDADEESGLVFGDTLPRIHAAEPNIWQKVKTIVVGEEGRERKKWQSIPFTPAANNAEQELPSEIAQWQASWFFVRFYDANDELIESTDFRLARGVSSIHINQSSLFPTENGHSSTLVEFHHIADCKIEPPSGLETAYSDGTTIAEIPPGVTFDKTCWNIATQGHDPIQATVLVERIWWAIGTKGKTPSDSEWIDKPLSLTRVDFAAVSEKVLWLRLPKQRWTDAVLVGFAQEAARQVSVPVTEQTVSIPLCDFESSEALRQISVLRFVVRVDDSVGALACVRVEAKCKRCDFVADSAADILSHVELRHLNVIFQPLTYEEHRKRNPALPRRIAICLICWEQGCHFVAREDSPRDNVNDMMKDHKRQKGHAHNFYEELTDVEKIRERLPSLIPDVQRCKLPSCEWEKESPSKTDLLRHLKENHLNALYELR